MEVLAPHAVFALLFWISFDRWVVPFQDHGREVMTAFRVWAGERLYLDVASYYGPLPTLLDAFALRLLGVRLGSLVLVRTLFAVLGVEALRRLSLRLGATPSLASAIAAAVTAIAFFSPPGPAPFPYSVAALEGAVATFWALELALGCRSASGAYAAAAVAGLAAGTKVEFLPAALLGPAIALLLRRPRREALAALGVAGSLAALAWGTPIALVGVETMKRHGFLVVLERPESWRGVYESITFGGMSGQAFLGGGFVDVLFPSALFLACGGVLIFAARGREWRVRSTALLLGASSVAIDGNGELHSLLLLAWFVAAAAAFGTLRAGRLPRGDPRRAAELAIVASMAPLLLRQPFFLGMGSYLPAAAPLALVVALVFAGRRLGSPGGLTFFLCGIVAAQVADRWSDFRGRPLERFASARADVLVPPGEARFLADAAGAIERWSRPGDFVAGLPEAGFLLFVTDRRSPFVDELFYPGNQDSRAEDEMIRALAGKPVRLVLVTDRPFPEYGSATYRSGVLDRFFEALDDAFVRVEGLKPDVPPSPATRRTARQAELFVPRGDRADAGRQGEEVRPDRTTRPFAGRDEGK
jgi:hypothetical protein